MIRCCLLQNYIYNGAIQYHADELMTMVLFSTVFFKI